MTGHYSIKLLGVLDLPAHSEKSAEYIINYLEGLSQSEADSEVEISVENSSGFKVRVLGNTPEFA